MTILIVSDCQTKAARVRHHLAQSGYECPLTNVVSIESVTKTVSSIQPKPDLIVFVLSHDDERPLAALHQLREAVETPILAIGPRDPNLILATLHAGVNDYLDESSDLHHDLSSTLGRLFESASKRATAGPLITVVGASGGSGRTLFATNLAVQLAKTHLRCGLFDLDLVGADVATFLNLKPRHSIADLCHNVSTLDQKMFEQSLLEHPSGVWVLAAPETWDEARFVSAEGLQKVIRFGKAHFPAVVVDLNAFWLSEYAQLLQTSTTVFLLLRLDFAGIRNAHRALTAMDRAGVDQNKLQLVAARYGRPKEISPAQAEAVLGMKIRHYLPEDQHTVNSCLNYGVPVVTEAPNSSIAKAIAAIAKAVCHHDTRHNGAATAPANGHKAPVMEKMRSFFGLSGNALAPRI